MKKSFLHRLLFLFLGVMSLSISGQVGIGTTTPRGALDINKATTYNMGLVLPTNTNPTNLINPQGGSLAEGTIMYDSTRKCPRFYNGTAWSDCLCDQCSGTTTPTLLADCTKNGFEGTYLNGVALSGAKFTVTLTNNSFSTATFALQTSDLVLSGVSSGITVSSVSPSSVTLTAGQTQIVTYTLTGTPANTGTLTGNWSKLSLNCSNTAQILRNFRFGSWNTSDLSMALQSQLTNKVNYGPNGTFVSNTGFTFTDITSALSTLSATQLFQTYDLIFTGSVEMSATEATKIKQYIEMGGVAIITLRSNVGTTIFNMLGGTGSIGSGVVNTTSTSDMVNNGIFGDARNITVSGTGGSYGRITSTQLPPNSTILSAMGTDPGVWIMGNNGGRAIFYWDSAAFNVNITGSDVDTPQEKFIHNTVVDLLHKRGL
ncbi:hypothetical protein DBR28_03820 [Chryseobacterium sp. HMWF028]|nr:hypothetical protein DBR28_03820 [Chryseobacterium sp. HMWF028]